METLTLKAETSRLLDLVIQSLYTQRDIFLRELVSNASDALDRLRFESLSDPTLQEDAQPLSIWLEVDSSARTLIVRDNGIGMSREQVIDHIGTIARSGTQEFEARLRSNSGREHALDLIGRFGVGFYSSFMVADRVTLLTRRAGQQQGTCWESTGDVNYTLTDVRDLPRGTSVVLHLKPVDTDAGLDDYTSRLVLSRIIKRYADFIAYPIHYKVSTNATLNGTTEATSAERHVLNSMTPIWTRAESDVSDDEYNEFYRHMCAEWTGPLLRMSLKADGRWEYSALLFIPEHAPHDLYYSAASYGLQLYSHRVMIVDNCRELLPRYLRFVKGVVDAADLPLNISRQALQHAHHITNIRKWLTRKIIDALGRLRATDEPRYLNVWRQFGRALKEGVSEDYDNKGRLASLILCGSSSHPSKLTTLSEYVSRMKPHQSEIFYLTGESRTIVERSPHLEECLARGYEVLYLTEPVDKVMMQSLSEFEGHRLRSVANGDVDFSDEAEREGMERELKEQADQFGALLGFLSTHLEESIRGARISKRLTESPACLLGDELDYSPQIERLLSRRQPARRRTLEVNVKHPIIVSMNERHKANSGDPLLAAGAELLLGAVLVAEGTELIDPVGFKVRIMELLTQSLQRESE
jgi:molecular chaperone HtpG